MTVNNLIYNNITHEIYSCNSIGYNVYELYPDIESRNLVYKNVSIDFLLLNRKYGHEIIVGIFNNTGTINNNSISEYNDMRKLNFRKSQLTVIDKNDVITTIIDLKSRILNIHNSNDEKYIVVLEKKIFIINADDFSISSTLDTYRNQEGICKILKSDNNKLITKGTSCGEICLYDFRTYTTKIIQSHNEDISSIGTSIDDKLIACASTLGTIIKIHNIDDEHDIKQFRRGTFASIIYDIDFSNDNRFMACCSGNRTLHIFDLQHNSKLNYRSTFYNITSYIPLLSSMCEYEWAGIKHTLLTSEKTNCFFDNNNILHIIDKIGNYYKVCGKNYDIMRHNLLI